MRSWFIIVGLVGLLGLTSPSLAAALNCTTSVTPCTYGSTARRLNAPPMRLSC